MSDSIRHATAQDAQSIADFQVAMALETENKKLDPDKVLVAVKSVFEDSQKGFYLVAEVDGQVVGSLMITYEWSDWHNGNMWYIQSVFVMAPHRGKGLFHQDVSQGDGVSQIGKRNLRSAVRGNG